MRALIDQYRGPAVIHDDELEVPVDVAYAVYRDKIWAGDQYLDGLTSWEGAFTTQSAVTVGDGALTLELPNGRRGSIVITSVEIDTRTGVRCKLLGTGDAPA